MSAAAWIAIGADLHCPTAASPAPGHVVVFARNANGGLIRLDRRDAGWLRTPVLDRPVAVTSGAGAPAPVDWELSACCDGEDSITLFGRSPEGDVVWRAGTASADDPFELLGAPAAMRDGFVFPMGLIGPPAACANGSRQLDIFGLSRGGELLHASRRNDQWSEFNPLGVPTLHVGGKHPQAVPVSARVAACRCGAKAIAVFLCTASGALLLKWWDGERWSEFASLGMPESGDETYPAVNVAAPLTGPPAACSWGPGRLDVFARGPRGDLVHKAWNGRDWGPFDSLGMPASEEGGRPRPLSFTGSVAACSGAPGSLEVFATAVDGNLYHARLIDQ